MRELQNKLNTLIGNVDKALISEIESQKAIYPFNTEITLIAYLLSIGKISYQDYIEIYSEYIERNKYLDLFQMAPRTFGQTWGEKYIKTLFPNFLKATKKNLAKIYPSFDGEFDLWLEGVRIEVKACRANNTNNKGSLAEKAYSHEEARLAGFQYHYQQLKPSCCDIFIWIGVYSDDLIYWVLTSEELKNTGKLTSQHRQKNKDKGVEVFEGQVFMTEEELAPFVVEEKDILNKVREKAKNCTCV